MNEQANRNDSFAHYSFLVVRSASFAIDSEFSGLYDFSAPMRHHISNHQTKNTILFDGNNLSVKQYGKKG